MLRYTPIYSDILRYAQIYPDIPRFGLDMLRYAQTIYFVYQIL